MKAMHKMLGAAVLGTLLTGAAFAQTANSTPSTPADNTTTTTQTKADKKAARHEKMAAKLGLTDDQKTQLKSIHQDATEHAKANKNDSTLSKDQKKAKLKDLHEQTMTKTNAILTPDQQQKMQQMKANHKGKRGHRGAKTQG
jgi:Spy/CpxP family protein refolding chaperone